jgi:hypothetical protein
MPDLVYRIKGRKNFLFRTELRLFIVFQSYKPFKLLALESYNRILLIITQQNKS